MQFLYYCCFCAIFKGAKHGTGEVRASIMFSTSLSMLIISMYMYFIPIFPMLMLNVTPIVFSILIAGLLVINYFATISYFVSTQRYVKIVEKYSYMTRNRKRIIGTIAIFIFFGSFTFFGYSGIRLSNYLNPF